MVKAARKPKFSTGVSSLQAWGGGILPAEIPTLSYLFPRSWPWKASCRRGEGQLVEEDESIMSVF